MKDTLKRLLKKSLIALSIILVILLISYAIYTAQMQEVAL